MLLILFAYIKCNLDCIIKCVLINIVRLTKDQLIARNVKGVARSADRAEDYHPTPWFLSALEYFSFFQVVLVLPSSDSALITTAYSWQLFSVINQPYSTRSSENSRQTKSVIRWRTQQRKSLTVCFCCCAHCIRKHRINELKDAKMRKQRVELWVHRYRWPLSLYT